MEKIFNEAQKYLTSLKEYSTYNEIKENCNFPTNVYLEVIYYLNSFVTGYYKDKVFEFNPQLSFKPDATLIKNMFQLRIEIADFSETLFIKIHKMFNISIEIASETMDIEEFKERLFFFTMARNDTFWKDVTHSFKTRIKSIAQKYPQIYTPIKINMGCYRFTPGFNIESHLENYKSNIFDRICNYV